MITVQDVKASIRRDLCELAFGTSLLLRLVFGIFFCLYWYFSFLEEALGKLL